MKITVVVGSHRQQSQSARIADHLISSHLSGVFSAIEKHDLATLDLPFWDEGIWQGADRWKEVLDPIFKTQKESDAFLIVSPEWGGMVPPKLKNYLLISSEQTMGHKPALLVGVSAGVNGAYPIAELRSHGTKNNKLLIVPDHLIVRNCENAFTAADEHVLTERISYSIQMLKEYAISLRQLRERIKIPSDFPYGM